MRWCVIRHPEVGAGVVAEISLPLHEPRGWVRTSDFRGSPDEFHPADLDAPIPVEPEPIESETSTAATPAKNKEK